MGVKVTVKGMDKVAAKAKKVIKAAMSDHTVRHDMANDKNGIVFKMVASARSGKDPATGNRFQELADSTINSRKRFKGRSDEEFFKPERSNLTLTGQLLKSVKAILPKGKPIIIISPTGRRDDGKRNVTIGKYHQTGTGVPERRFLGISEQMAKAANTIFKRHLRRRLTRLRKAKL